MDFANGFLGGRIDGLKGLAILAFDELIVNEAKSTRVSLCSGPIGLRWGRDVVGLKCGVNAMTGQKSPQRWYAFEVKDIGVE